MKIINIGFNRSGTQSLSKYFEQLNFKVSHWAEGQLSKTVKDNFDNSRMLLTRLEHYDVLLDLEHFDRQSKLGYYKSYQKHYKQIAQQYPNCYFIFTYRSEGHWIKSLLHHLINFRKIISLDYMVEISNMTIIELINILKIEYNSHFESVKQYFIETDRLLMFNLDELPISINNLNEFLAAKKFNYQPTFKLYPNIGTGKVKKLSFMICCFDRTEHLLQTIHQNIDDNRQNCDQIEFVIVHYIRDRKSTLIRYFKKHFPNEMHSGYLKYFTNLDFESWKAGPCRYTAFWYTRGQLVYNLDCDNFTGINGGYRLLHIYNLYGFDELVYCGFNGQYSEGSCGRICLSENNHFKIGSYDYLLPTIWSHDDILLLLESVINLGIKILISDINNLKPLLHGIFRRLSISETQLSEISQYGTIVEPTINKHHGIMHSRKESFKTVTYSNLATILDTDLENGFKYIKKKFANINLGDTIIKWRQTYTCLSIFNNQNHNQIFQTIDDFLIDRENIILVASFDDVSQLPDLINLIISAKLLSIKFAIIGNITLILKLNKYSIDLINGNFNDLVNKSNAIGSIIVKVKYNAVLCSQSIIRHIKFLIQQYPKQSVIEDNNKLIYAVINNKQGDLPMIYDFQSSKLVHCKTDNLWLVDIFNRSWIILDNIQKIQQNDYTFLQKLLEPMSHCGIDIIYANNIHYPDLNIPHIIIVLGSDINICINPSHVYLIVQPDINFDYTLYANVPFLILAYRKTTNFNTFIITNNIDYIELFSAINKQIQQQAQIYP